MEPGLNDKPRKLVTNAELSIADEIEALESEQAELQPLASRFMAGRR
jgi:hypothetical protein